MPFPEGILNFNKVYQKTVKAFLLGVAYISQKGLYVICHKIHVWYNFLSYVSSLSVTLKLFPTLFAIKSRSTKNSHLANVISYYSTSSSVLLEYASHSPASGLRPDYSLCLECVYPTQPHSLPSFYSCLCCNVPSPRVTALLALYTRCHPTLLVCLDSKYHYQALQALFTVYCPPSPIPTRA